MLNLPFILNIFLLPLELCSYPSSKAIGCQWVSQSLCCLFPTFSETLNPKDLKFWGMIPLGVQNYAFAAKSEENHSFDGGSLYSLYRILWFFKCIGVNFVEDHYYYNFVVAQPLVLITILIRCITYQV